MVPRQLARNPLPEFFRLANRSAGVRYSFAVLCSATALIFQVAMEPWVGVRPFLFTYPATFLAASLAGFGPAGVSVLIGALGIDYFFFPPRNTFAIPEMSNAIALFIFSASSLLVGFISHQKQRIEKAVIRQISENQLFRDVLESIPQVVWRTNPDGSADYFNHRLYDEVGTSPEEFQGWGWAERIHPEDRPAIVQEWQRCRELEIGTAGEFRILCADGRYRWFLSLGNPFRDERGKIIKYYGTWTNIDAIKHAQEESQRSLKARDEFLSLASHELKTPLTSLKLQSQVITHGLKKNDPSFWSRERMEKLTQQTDRQVTRLNRLVNDMLDVSRIETGRLVLEREWIDLTELARETVSQLQDIAAEIGVPSVTVNSNEVIRGSWDRLRIEQVLINLLVNAYRYGNGTAVEVSVKCAGKNAILMVRDHGRGISPEDQTRIFARFGRAISRSEVSGLGLGLYIAQEIVNAHGGRIGVESELGKGAAFIVELPLHASTV